MRWYGPSGGAPRPSQGPADPRLNLQVPVGTVIIYAGPVDCDNTSAIDSNLASTGWLVCRGQILANADFPALSGVIGQAYGHDGADTFRLPDFRGRFLRGQDHSAGNDPDVAGRQATDGGNSGDNVGSYQPDAFQGHEHDFDGNEGAAIIAEEGTPATSLASIPTTGCVTDGTNGTPRTSSETRPVNVYVNYLIKYR